MEAGPSSSPSLLHVNSRLTDNEAEDKAATGAEGGAEFLHRVPIHDGASDCREAVRQRHVRHRQHVVGGLAITLLHPVTI